MKFKFFTIQEKVPRHRENIIWINPRGSFNSLILDVRQGSVEYMWEEIDPEDGLATGCCVIYSGEESMDDCRLIITIEGRIFDHYFLWAKTDTIFDKLEAHVSKAEAEYER